ncbi:hypothetical protein D3C81_1497530 [compost metagenome]
MDLTVSIGDAHIIHIDERNRANTSTRQCFRRPRSHATNPDHANMRPGKQLQGIFTIQTRGATKTLTPGVAYYH